MKRMKCLLCVLFAVMLTVVSPTYLHAQADRGGIKGVDSRRKRCQRAWSEDYAEK